MKKSIIVNQFFQMKERDGLNIAANTDISYGDALEKLKRKYGIKKFDGITYSTYIDGELIELFKINNRVYGKSADSDDYWNIDARTFEKEVPEYKGLSYDDDDEGYPTGKTVIRYETEYQINSSLTDKNILEFLKAYQYLESKGRALRYNKTKAKRVAASDEFKKAKAFIKVEILDSEYRTAEDFADDVDEEDWKFYDEDSKFKIRVSVGKTELFTGTVYPVVDFSGSYRSYHTPATMYNRYGDPGDPEEGAAAVTVTFDGIESNFYMENESGEEITTGDFTDKVPKGMFRNLYEKYANEVIIDAIDSLIEKDGDYEDSYSW